MTAAPTTAQEISDRLGPAAVPQETHDRIPTFWVTKDRVPAVLRFLKEEIDRPYKMLYDLSAIDERMKTHRDGHRRAILRLSIIFFPLTGTNICASK